MPENQTSNKVYSLLDIAQSIERAFRKWYTGAYWIKAEMNKLNFYKYSGHCYPDLLERREGKVVAQLRATLWATDYRRINSRFMEVLKEPLKDGINILFLAKVTYNAVHGLSLSILDIDPAYTLGDLEREKLEAINRLRQEGIFTQNKLLPLTPLPGRLAIISVETSKGLSDFMQITEKNQWGYRFFTMLFPALLQGDKSPESILGQLRRIRRVIKHFDAVAIIRGGGGDVGLSSYNNYQLAKAVAGFPIPVFTGIGHSTNETVTEMVAHVNAITPSKLADFLIQQFHNFSVPVSEASKKISELSQQLMRISRQQLTEEMRLFKTVSGGRLALNFQVLNIARQQTKQHAIAALNQKRAHLRTMQISATRHPPLLINRFKSHLQQSGVLLEKSAAVFFKNSHRDISSLDQQLKILHPENVLKRGYSITLFNGKTVSAAGQLKQEDEVETILFRGKIKSKVIHINKKNQHE
jgi:exodeoxyribonuclease VII large subunit